MRSRRSPTWKRQLDALEFETAGRLLRPDPPLVLQRQLGALEFETMITLRATPHSLAWQRQLDALEFETWIPSTLMRLPICDNGSSAPWKTETRQT
jgi:hypothetical protein